MQWYLIYTKPRQEQQALENLERQGYECYLPVFRKEKLRQNQVALADEPLFPRYLFIRLERGRSAKSWAPIRSTRGVSRLVSFGAEPARIDDDLVSFLKSAEAAGKRSPIRMFSKDERVKLTAGPFAGMEGVYQMADGEQRAFVLIEFLSKSVALRVSPASLRKI